MQFMTSNGIRHVTCSPYLLQSNGLFFKECMKRQPTAYSIENRLSKFLLWYRLTPHSTTGTAPAELLMGRHSRSVLDLLKPDLQSEEQAGNRRHTMIALLSIGISRLFLCKTFRITRIGFQVLCQKAHCTLYRCLMDEGFVVMWNAFVFAHVRLLLTLQTLIWGYHVSPLHTTLHQLILVALHHFLIHLITDLPESELLQIIFIHTLICFS